MKKDQMKDFIEETIAKEIKKLISESVSNEVYIIKHNGQPVEQFKTQEEADKALEVYKAKHPDQELIVEPGEELSFEELDKMSEKLENMENINETKHKGYFTTAQVMKLAKKAGYWVLDAGDDLLELCAAYGDKIPASEVFEVLDDYDMQELKSKIRVKKVEPKEGDFTAPEVTMDEKLYGDQHKLDVDKDGDIGADDLAKLRAGKEETKEEEEECMECGDGYMEEGVCEKCGKEICECGGGIMESKKSIKLTESELISLITNIVNESFPAAELQGTVHKKSGEQNEDALSDVEEKIKEYLEAQDRHEKALKGDTKMGNSQDAANVIPSKLGEKIIKKVKKKDQEESEAQMYAKAVQPSRETKKKDVVSEEIQRMKQMASYNKKTQ